MTENGSRCYVSIKTNFSKTFTNLKKQTFLKQNKLIKGEQKYHCFMNNSKNMYSCDVVTTSFW